MPTNNFIVCVVKEFWEEAHI